MKSRTTKWILVCAFVAAGALLVGRLATRQSTAREESNGAKRPKAATVETQKATVGKLARTLELSGEVVSTNSVVIAATKEGPIAYCPWREGDEVNAGEKLVEIDRAVHRAEVQTARAALEVADAKLADLKAGARPEEIEQARASVQRWQATLEEAQAAYERQKQLRSNDFTSQQAVDQALERLKVARAELANAQVRLRMLQAGPTQTDIAVQKAAVNEATARLKLAEAHLEECIVRAPFDAVVAKVYVRAGDLATPRSPLVDLFDPDSLVVRFSVPEAHSAAVRPGLGIEARLDAIATETFHGKVERVYPRLAPDMRTRTVEARLEESVRLMPHQFARLTLTLESVSGAVTVPAPAIREMPDGRTAAYVVIDGKAIRRMVQVGIQQADRVQILEGIEAGEQVIVVGNETLKDGVPVRVVGAAQKDRPSGGSPNEATPGGQGESGGGLQ